MKEMEIVPYDPSWPEKFEREAEKIKSVLGEHCIATHHIGSTAVPDLQATPIIDVISVVDNILEIDQFTEEIEQFGYLALGEHGKPFHRFFQKYGKAGSFHVHMYEAENPEIERHLMFRDYLRDHEPERVLFGCYKKCLSEEFQHDIGMYSARKITFVGVILSRIGFDKLIVKEPELDVDWEFVGKTRNKYYHLLQMTDPYRDTLEAQKHVHFILTQGANLIGYAHILREFGKPSKLILLLVDKHNGQHLAHFEKFCDRWIDQQIKIGSK